MNKKQKNIIGLTAVLIIGKLWGGLQIAFQFGAWDIFLQKTITSWLYYVMVILFSLVLVMLFKTDS